VTLEALKFSLNVVEAVTFAEGAMLSGPAVAIEPVIKRYRVASTCL
jgi:hypothetical protein